jgi:hypothetical protein
MLPALTRSSRLAVAAHHRPPVTSAQSYRNFHTISSDNNRIPNQQLSQATRVGEQRRSIFIEGIAAWYTLGLADDSRGTLGEWFWLAITTGFSLKVLYDCAVHDYNVYTGAADDRARSSSFRRDDT